LQGGIYINVEKYLKNNLNLDKEALALSEAISIIAARSVISSDNQDQAMLEEYSQELTILQCTSLEIDKIINSIADTEIKNIFALRYISKLNWIEIQNKTFLSESTLFRLHAKGIKWLEQNYKP